MRIDRRPTLNGRAMAGSSVGRWRRRRWRRKVDLDGLNQDTTFCCEQATLISPMPPSAQAPVAAADSPRRVDRGSFCCEQIISPLPCFAAPAPAAAAAG